MADNKIIPGKAHRRCATHEIDYFYDSDIWEQVSLSDESSEARREFKVLLVNMCTDTSVIKNSSFYL